MPGLTRPVPRALEEWRRVRARISHDHIGRTLRPLVLALIGRPSDRDAIWRALREHWRDVVYPEVRLLLRESYRVLTPQAVLEGLVDRVLVRKLTHGALVQQCGKPSLASGILAIRAQARAVNALLACDCEHDCCSTRLLDAVDQLRRMIGALPQTVELPCPSPRVY